MCTNDIKENPMNFRSPSEIGLSHKEVRIKTKDNLTLYGWFMYKGNNKKTFIYFHENAGNIGFRIPFSEFLIRQLHVNVLVVGYRGYGYSEGEPTESGIMMDAEAIVDYVFNKETEITEFIDKSNVYIFGRSLGGAVALYISEKLKPSIKGLILENTFSSMGDMVDHIFPYLRRVKYFLLRNKWPSKERIKNLKYPIFFISSEKDEIVPSGHMEELYTMASKAAFKQKFVIIGGTHNDSWNRVIDAYVDQLQTFMDKCESFSNGENSYGNILNTIHDIPSCDPDLSISEESSINKEEESYLIDKKTE